jgi:hypothetical protein
MKRVFLVLVCVLAQVGTARAEGDYFLSRDQGESAEIYLDSDGGVESDEPQESPFDIWVEEEPQDLARFEMPGFWDIRETSPIRQALVVGPTFRNVENRTETGGAVGYINNNRALPFQLSVETTWVRIKRADDTKRSFTRIRVPFNAQLWRRSSRWESTAFAANTFFQRQTDTFTQTEVGGSLTETIGQRLSLTARLVWARRDFDGPAQERNAAVAVFSGAYNLGAGVRVGGFYELYNRTVREDDWGAFGAYQFLPFAEAILDGGKNEFVRFRLVFTAALQRPPQ